MGGFHQLRICPQTSFCHQLLKLHQIFTPRSILVARRCSFRPLAAVTRECCTSISLFGEKVGSETYTSTERSKLRELRDFPSSNIVDRPAVVIVFDIETTGFNLETERVIEFAARDLRGGEGGAFETLVNPEKPVRNTGVHGISTDMVNKPDVPRFKEMIPMLLKFVKGRQIDGKPVLLVAHNALRFDVPFIVREFRRCSIEVPSDWLFLDTLPLARRLVNSDGTKVASCRLQALRERWRIRLAGPAHRAMQDVETLCHVLRRISFELRITVPQLLEEAFRAADVTKSSD